MELKIGAIVQCRDGVAGRLKYVVIDPDDNMVTYLIVERGALLRRDIVVPAAWVVRADAETIVLNASASPSALRPRPPAPASPASSRAAAA